MEKGKNAFQDLKPEERVSALEGIAAKYEYQKIRRHYDDDEKSQMKDFVASESIDNMNKEEEFSSIKKDFNTAIKTRRKAIGGALKDLERGYSENEERVFLIDDQDEGLMFIYDSKGVFLSSRKLYPDERQVKILEISEKTGTND